MDWFVAITGMYSNTEPERYPRFYSPAELPEIEVAEGKLGSDFPADLRHVLSCTDGVEEVLVHVTGDVATGWLIWPVSQIVRENRLVRNASLSTTAQELIRGVLFFASAGADGILFGYQSTEQADGRRAIAAWNPLEESLVPIGYDLEPFLQQWVSGSIKL